MLTYLTTDAVWFHKSGDRLRALAWPRPSVSDAAPSDARTLLDVVRVPRSLHAFPGLWVTGLVSQPMYGSATHTGLVLTTSWRSTDVVCVCVFRGVGPSTLHRFEFDGLPLDASVALHDVQGNGAGGARGTQHFLIAIAVC